MKVNWEIFENELNRGIRLAEEKIKEINDTPQSMMTIMQKISLDTNICSLQIVLNSFREAKEYGE